MSTGAHGNVQVGERRIVTAVVDGLVGMQNSDILIELAGVQLQDLPSILI